MGHADRDDQGGPARWPGRCLRPPGGLGGNREAVARRPAGPDGDPAPREGRNRTDQLCTGADSAKAPTPGAPERHGRARSHGAPAGAGYAAGALQGSGSSPGRAAHAADGDGRRRRGQWQGEGAAPSPDRRHLLPERDGDWRQGDALCGEGLGVRCRRSPRGEHRGRRVPGHLRHGHDGHDHERARDAAGRAGGLLPSGVREARARS